MRTSSLPQYGVVKVGLWESYRAKYFLLMKTPSLKNPLSPNGEGTSTNVNMDIDAASNMTINKPKRSLETEVDSGAQKRHNSSRGPTPVPRFLIIHAVNKEVRLSSKSPFFINKALVAAAGAPKSVQKLRSGDLLVETSNTQHSELLLRTASLCDIAITVTPHQFLNSSRGVISEVDLLECEESEIVTELQDQGVIAARRILSRRDGKFVPTNNIILTFNTPTLPDAIKAGYLHCRVRPYIPNPVRCFKCQLFGHSQQSCRGSVTCGHCGSRQHESSSCKEPPFCINCKGDHPAYARACPKWAEEKEIQRIKTLERISYPEARRRVAPKSSLKASYASTLKMTTVSSSVQTVISIPPTEKVTSMAKYMPRTISKPISKPNARRQQSTSTSTITKGTQSTSPVLRSINKTDNIFSGSLTGAASRKQTAVSFKLTPIGKVKKKKQNARSMSISLSKNLNILNNSDTDAIELNSIDECL